MNVILLPFKVIRGFIRGFASPCNWRLLFFCILIGFATHNWYAAASVFVGMAYFVIDILNALATDIMQSLRKMQNERQLGQD